MRRLLLLGLLFVALPALAESDALEKRAHHLAEQIRCMVCQGQSINESDADLAKDLNALIREQIKMGWSDEQILDYLSVRYGDFILFKPPFASYTWLLWCGPLFLLSGGVLLIYNYWRRQR